MEFGIPGYNDLLWDVSLVSDRISSSTQYGLNGKLQLGDYLNTWARHKIGSSDVIMLPFKFQGNFRPKHCCENRVDL